MYEAGMATVFFWFVIRISQIITYSYYIYYRYQLFYNGII